MVTRLLFVLLIGSLSLNSAMHAVAEEDGSRPNIILVVCDDLGFADVGFNGAKDIRTPELDALARGGIVCSSGYVCHPFCGPSRMGMLAGRYPHAIGTPFNLPPSGIDYKEFAGEGVPVGESLISTLLQDAGYQTAAVGKWHLGFDAPFHPNRRGFDEYFGFLGGGHKYFPNQYQPIYERQKNNGVKVFNEYITPLQRNGTEVSETEYLTDGLSREAVRFVENSSENDSPFFLYLAYNAPHTPLEAKPEDLAQFIDIKDEKRRTYAAMVYAVDRGIGKLKDALEISGQLRNTLIVFLSDNGGKIGAGANNGPLSRGKGSVCEGGIRVPMFFHWPNRLGAGERFDFPVTALDFYPTFARVANAEIPADKGIDGVDILPALLSSSNPRPGKAIYALRHWNGFHNVAVRRDQWKVTRLGPKAPWKLFDLDSDVSESLDRSQENETLVRELVNEAREWSRGHIAPRWFDNPQAAENWKRHSMPDYRRTFALKRVLSKTNEAVDVDSNWSEQEYVRREKQKWELMGWTWNESKVLADFREIDANQDGVASGKERKAWYETKKNAK